MTLMFRRSDAFGLPVVDVNGAGHALATTNRRDREF